MALTAYESATRLVDSAASGRVLVLGPTRRAAACVDLVCRREDALSIRAALAEDGFVGRGASLARFDDRGTVAVTVIDADDWKHSEPVVEDAFARATSMAGCSRLAQAQLADELLILCRRVDELSRVVS